MGLHQSVQAFAKIGGPLIAGCVLTLTPLATVLLSPLFYPCQPGYLRPPR